MTEIGERKVQNLIKFGCFLSLLRFSDLNSEIVPQPRKPYVCSHDSCASINDS